MIVSWTEESGGCGGSVNDFPNDFVMEDVQGVCEGFEEFAESSVCGRWEWVKVGDIGQWVGGRNIG